MQVATVYFMDGTKEEIQPKDRKKFTLIELQGFVGGYIEHVKMMPGNGRGMLYVNEDGLMRGLAHNPQASALAGTHIVGDAVVVRTPRKK